MPKIIAIKQFCWDLHQSCLAKNPILLWHRVLSSCVDQTLRTKGGLVKTPGHGEGLARRAVAHELLAGVSWTLSRVTGKGVILPLPCLSSGKVNLARSRGLPAGGDGHECTHGSHRGTKACSNTPQIPAPTHPCSADLELILGPMKGGSLSKFNGESKDYLTGRQGETVGPAPISGDEKLSMLPVPRKNLLRMSLPEERTPPPAVRTSL